MPAVAPEMLYTTLVALFTGLLWVPIVLNRLVEIGLLNALKNPQRDAQAQADWAFRLANAHKNAVENLVVFAPLAISVHVLGLGTALTAAAAAAYFYARVAHAVVYAFGIPVLRTLAFTVGFICQLIMAGQILGWL